MIEDLRFALQDIADGMGVQAEALDGLGQHTPATALRTQEDRILALIRDHFT